MHSDGGRASAGITREQLYNFWKKHPTVRDNCCYIDDVESVINQLFEEISNFNNNFMEYAKSLDENVATELREELASFCANHGTDQFCKIQTVFPVLDKILELPSSKSSWTDETYMQQSFISIGFVILKRKHLPNLVIEEDSILVEATNVIISLVRNNEVELLERLSPYFPPLDEFEALGSCKSDHLCLFGKITEKALSFISEVKSYANGNIINGKRTLMINTNTDYGEFLKQKQLDRILEVLSEQQYTSTEIANELKSHMNSKFSELRTYFQSIETFNSEIARADINFVDDRLAHFGERVAKVGPQLDETLEQIITLAYAIVANDIYETGLRTAIAVASVFNPLKSILGGGSAVDVLDAMKQLALAISKFVRLETVSNKFDALQVTAEEFATKFATTDRFLESVKVMVLKEAANRTEFNTAKNVFIENYIAFNPKVSKEDLAGSKALWTGLIDAACDVIMNPDSVIGAGIKSKAEKDGWCIDAPVLVEKLYTLYGEIYDFQFELMTAMASYTASLVALDASHEISDEFVRVAGLNPDAGTTLSTLSLLGGLSYITYKTHVSKTVHLYCDILEYMEAGTRPSSCKGLETDVSLLLSNTIPECTSEIHSFFYNVPTKATFDGDTAFINMDQLMSGEWTSFQITDSDWLVGKKWIQEYERDYAIYVKQFEIYLPIDIGERVEDFTTLADPVLHNAVVPNGTQFIITPNVRLVHEYQMGSADKVSCKNAKLKNPYTHCKSKEGDICELSYLQQKPLYPSIYSRWNVKVAGSANLTVPDPATDFNLIIGMKLCKMSNEVNVDIDFDSFAETQSTQPCCPEGQYRPTIESHCEDCPSCSHSALAGYYCEKSHCVG